MRLWSLHPRYLDQAGLVALWREALLAQAVLRGETRGYRNHPQLVRFRNHPNPRGAIAAYLEAVHREASGRGYRFNAMKIGPHATTFPVPVTRGQVQYERLHLLKKLRVRDLCAYKALMKVIEPEPHPLLTIVEGGIERWERISDHENGRHVPFHADEQDTGRPRKKKARLDTAICKKGSGRGSPSA